ncbi:MAG: prolipoprotein diacylglyceryl transferase [Bellilinea sp.]|nr:prolipoprotein diacylglyceryl transferase [Bellilinea sp.]
MLPVVNIGPLAVQLPGLILLVGIWIGLNRSEALARRRGMEVERVNTLIFYSLLAGILGARLGYIAQNLAAFSQRPLDALSLSPQMLDMPSGLAAMVLTGLIYGQRKGLDLWRTLDALTPGLAVVMMAVALMNLASGDGFGLPARLFWSIYLFGEWRHPTQIYDFALALLIWRVIESRADDLTLPDGTRFLTFVALSAIARILVDAFRVESVVSGLGGVRITQVIALLILLASVQLIRTRRSFQEKRES